MNKILRYIRIFEFLISYPKHIARYPKFCCYIRIILHFSEAEVRKERSQSALYPNFRHYIRSELRFTKDEAKVQNFALNPNFDVLSEVNCVFTKKEGHVRILSVSFPSNPFWFFWVV